MAIENKYRIHEVAKDFSLTSKVISQILTDYIAPPKNHMQVLEDNELDVIFEYLTQKNQVESLETIFNVAPAEKSATPEKAEKKESAQENAKSEAAQKKAPAAQTKEKEEPKEHKKPAENKPHVPKKVAEKRVVDTRGGVAVNIDKYNACSTTKTPKASMSRCSRRTSTPAWASNASPPSCRARAAAI